MIPEKRPFNKLIPISFEQVEILDDFWSRKQKVFRNKAIYHQHQKLEEYKHIDNFRVASRLKSGIFRGVFFFDSDLYKWLEAACYILQLQKQKMQDLEVKVKEIVDLIVKAQESDGYLNTFYSIMVPELRFSNPLIMHELYCMGHFFEAAIAYYNATSKLDLINVASKCVDLLIDNFINKKLKGAPGHQEIELALIKLFQLTQEYKYLDLAEEFINRRGNIKGYKKWAMKCIRNAAATFKKEKQIIKKYEETNDDFYKVEKYAVKMSFFHRLKGIYRIFREFINGKYFQLDVPVRKAREPVGHAVRAMYLYTAMADLYSEKGDSALLEALKVIWEQMVEKKMYITGGIGSIGVLEGFGKDYKLNNKNSYSETCAAIGNMFWNWRMTQIKPEARYADLFERLLYNAMLVGPSLDGCSYMYNNPLESNGKNERYDWYTVACCPSNIARIISSLGGYIYSISEHQIWVHQYIGSKSKVFLGNTPIKIIQESKFPWEGKITLRLEMKENQELIVKLRIPEWCKETKILINKEVVHGMFTPSTYFEIEREWTDQDQISLLFSMEPTLLYADPHVKKNKGKVAIYNGPVIYCMEQRDNKDFNVLKAKIAKDPEFELFYDPTLLGGINLIKGKLSTGKKFTAIPYHTWLNRGPNKMIMWIKGEK
ncbi:MAG: glycoside hydrolase family 127 protein [Promethearchaeota archaeon]